MTVKYLLNEKGEKEAAVIPIKEWEAIMKQLNGEENEAVKSVQQSLTELKAIEKGDLKPLSVKELLDEL